jgi:GNAT superfamily N-acetyltransferase
MARQQERTPFVWNEPKPSIIVPNRLNFRPLEEEDTEFLRAIRLCLSESLDRYDQARLKELGAVELARQCFEEVESDFDYRRQWWHLAYTKSGSLLGFIQPVIYRGCCKGNLEEGTIYHMGVIPMYRGHGYGRDLLCKATAVLQEVGVWRIFADADTLNVPMLKTFAAVGYESLHH